MPVVTVQGMPPSCKLHLLDLKRQIKKCIAGVSELELEPEQVSVFFPPDLLDEGLGEELVVTVSKLFAGAAFPERTPEVLQRVALNLRDVFKHFVEQHLPLYHLVEVFVQTVVYERILMVSFARPPRA